MDEFNLGDHLRSCRTGYSHHGLYVGAGRVIHYAGLRTATVKDGPIEEVMIADFAAGQAIEVVHHPQRRHDAAAAVARARSRLGENLYSVVDNNCEHFVLWCIDGEHTSQQVDIGVTGGGAAATAVAGTGALGVVGTVAVAGTAGGAQLMSGLAAVGGLVGGGAVAGIATVALAPAAAAATFVSAVVLPDREALPPEERSARRYGRAASIGGAAVGTAGAVGAVAAAGTAGLSAAGITSGLAAIGATVGGGMAAGVVLTAAAPAAAALTAGYGLYKALKWLGR